MLLSQFYPSLLAAFAGGFVTSTSLATFQLSVQSTQLNGADAGLMRVTLYALGNEADGDILYADLTITAWTANGLKFSYIPPSIEEMAPADVALTSPNLQVVKRTRVNSTLFQTIEPGSVTPSIDEDVVAANYGNGVTSFHISGFDGRVGSDVGVKAGVTVNGGLGAAIAAAVVPTVYDVPGAIFSGTLYSDIQGAVPTRFSTAPIVEPGLPVVVSPPAQTVTFGQNVSGGLAFSATVTATSVNQSDLLSLAVGTPPPGVFNITVSPLAGSTSPATFTITGLLNYSTNGSAVTIPVSVSNGYAIGLGKIVLNVVPEPAAVATLAGVATIVARRRRRV